jgi:hypothetical protein
VTVDDNKTHVICKAHPSWRRQQTKDECQAYIVITQHYLLKQAASGRRFPLPKSCPARGVVAEPFIPKPCAQRSAWHFVAYVGYPHGACWLQQIEGHCFRLLTMFARRSLQGRFASSGAQDPLSGRVLCSHTECIQMNTNLMCMGPV